MAAEQNARKLILGAPIGLGSVIVILMFFWPEPLSELRFSDALVALLGIFSCPVIGSGMGVLGTTLWGRFVSGVSAGGYALGLGAVIATTVACYAEMAVMLLMGDPGIGGAFLIMGAGLLVGGTVAAVAPRWIVHRRERCRAPA